MINGLDNHIGGAALYPATATYIAHEDTEELLTRMADPDRTVRYVCRRSRCAGANRHVCRPPHGVSDLGRSYHAYLARQLGGVDVWTESHCFQLVQALRID